MAFEKIGLKYVVEGADGGLSDLKKLAAAERDVGEEAKDASGKINSVGKGAASAALGFAAAELGMKALKSAFQFGIGNAIEFEHKIDAVGAVSGATEVELSALADTAKQLGADTAFSAGEAASAMEELAAGGRSVSQILGGEATAAVNLAAAGGYGLADSARTIATTMAIWEDQQLDTNDVVNRLAGAANTSRFGVEDMSAAIAQGGGVAATAGVSFQDFATGIAATAASFASGSDAGTSFKTFITSLSGSSEKAKDMIKELGLQFYNAQGALRPMSEIVQELNEKLSGLTPEMQTVALKTIFGNDAFRTAASLMKLTGEEFTAMSNTMRDTSAADVAKQRMDNLHGSIEEFKGSLETLGIELGTKAIPMLNGLTQGSTAALNAFGALPGSTQNLVFAFLGFTAAAPVVIGQMQKLFTSADGASSGIQKLGQFMGTSAGKATLFAAAIGGVVIAVDLILQKTTGAGLMDRIFGDVSRMESAARATDDWAAAVLAAGPNADQLSLAQRNLNATLEASNGNLDGQSNRLQDISTAAASIGVPGVGPLAGLATNIATADGRIFGFNVGLSDGNDKLKKFEEQTRFLGQQMVSQGATVTQLKDAYDTLPPVLQKVFDEETHVVEGYKLFEQSLDVDRIEAYARAGLIPVATTLGDLGAVILPPARTALDEFNDSVEEGEDRAKEFESVLDTLAGRFQTFNPEVIEAEGRLAAIDEELADLNRSGGDWSETLGMTKQQLIDAKKGLEDFVTAAGENEKSVKGMRDELRLYINDGLLNLDTKLRDSNLTLEEQVTVQQKVGEALRALAKDDVPGFIAAMQVVEDKVPGIAQTVYRELGPDMKAKIDGAQGLMREAGLGLATALSQGVIAGLSSASTDIGDKSSRLMSDAIAAMNAAAGISSPSKITEAMGVFLAEGLVLGFEKGRPMVVASAEQMVEEGIASAKAVLDKALSSGQLVPYLGTDGKWHLPGSGAAGAIGADPNPDLSNPNGTTSTYIGGDQYAALPNTPKVGDTYGTGTAKMVFDGKKWVQGGIGFSDYIPEGHTGMVGAPPAMASVAGSPQYQSTIQQSQALTFDFRGAQMTGTPLENERMIRNVVYEALGDVSGRDAFLAGVK